PVIFDHLANEAIAERHTLIADHYEARQRQSQAGGLGDSVPYKPLPPEHLYVDPEAFSDLPNERLVVRFTPFQAPDHDSGRVLHAGVTAGRSFAAERADPGANVFDHVVRHIGELRAGGRRVLVAGWSEGSLDRLGQ